MGRFIASLLVVATTRAASLAPTARPEPRTAEPTPVQPLARFGINRLRLPAPVRSVAVAPDGKTVAATTATDPIVRLWDTATARPVRKLRGSVEPTDSLSLVGFTPDGRRLIVVRHQSRRPDHADRPWHEPATIDLATGTVARWGWGSEAEHYLPVFAVSPDGRTVAGVTAYADIVVWDAATGRELHKLGRLKKWLMRHPASVCFSPDGRQVAACNDEAGFYVGPGDGSKPLRYIPVGGQQKNVNSVFWPRPDRVVALWYNGLAAFDAVTGREVARDSTGGNMISNPRAAAGDTLFVKRNSDEDLVAIDLTTLAQIPGRAHRGGRRDEPFAVSADGRTVALAAGVSVRLFDATADPLHPDSDRHPADPAERLQVSADGRRLFSTGGRSAQTWDLTTGRLLASFDDPAGGRLRPAPFTLSAAGRRVAGGRTPDGQLVVRDADTGAEVFREPAVEGGWLTSVVGFADDRRLWVRDIQSGNFRRLGVAGADPGPAVSGFPGTAFTAVSADGRRLATAGHQALAVRDADPGGRWVELESYRGRPGPGCGLSPPRCAVPVGFGLDGRCLLTWDRESRTLAVWDLTDPPALVGLLDASGAWAQEWGWPAAVFAPDGRRVAAATREKDGSRSVRVWETASATELFRFHPPDGATACVFTPDGKQLIVAHPDTTFGVWDYPALEAGAVAPVPATAPDGVWDRLGDPDPKVGQAAVRALAADPAVAGWVADLDAPAFANREAASKALGAAGEAVEGPLRGAMGSPSAEVRRRAERLLRAFEPKNGRRPAAQVRTARAVEALERAGTPAADRLLAEWAAGPAGGFRAREAAAAIARRAAGR